MLRTSESETEILLGNKQLLGIFFVVAVLLGVAYASGFMVGTGSGSRKPSSSPTDVASSANPAAAGGETHSVPAEAAGDGTGPATEALSGARVDETAGSAPRHAKADTTMAKVSNAQENDEPLGSPKRKPHDVQPEQMPDVAPLSSPGTFSPRDGQAFLQVAAVGHDEAAAVADVLLTLCQSQATLRFTGF